MIQLFEENCVRSLFVRSSCVECSKACPHDAFRLENGPPQLDEEACTECGLCVTACEQGALQSSTYTFKYPSLKEKQTGYSCLSTEVMEGVKRIPCLGMLDETELLTQAYHQGENISLWAGDCKHCQWQLGEELLERRLDSVQELAHQLEIPVNIKISKETRNNRPFKLFGGKGEQREKKVPSIHRRDLFFQGFKWLENQSKVHALEKVEEVIDQVQLVEHLWSEECDQDNKTKLNSRESLAPHMQKKVTKRRNTLLDLVKATGFPVSIPLKGLAVPKEINERCDGCQLCIYSCTTGALKGQEVDGKYTISFFSNYCLDCSVCIDNCPTQAIKEGAILTTTLITLGQRKCKKCHEAFVCMGDDAEELCTICKNKLSLLML
jgi:ferredoxin